jgi:hypothetical protein
MTTGHHNSNVTRRTALAGLSASAVVIATSRPGSAQTINTANHPLMGVWLAMANPPLPTNPRVVVQANFGADGAMLLMYPLTQAGPQGIQFNSAYVGIWEPYDEQTGHFTATQSLSDADGTFLGTVTVDGHPKVSEDGNSFTDDGSLVTVTIRDATGAVVNVIPPTVSETPVTGIRMRVGNPGFPGEEDATPVP